MLSHSESKPPDSYETKYPKLITLIITSNTVDSTYLGHTFTAIIIKAIK